MSKIEWTELTLNPTTGCDKVSAGCKNCYAIRMAWRLAHSPNVAIRAKYLGTVVKTEHGQLNWTGQINFDHSVFNKLKSNKPKVYFVNSMSDLFHEKIPFEFILKCFAKFEYYDNHTYQILTKRAQRMVEFFKWMKVYDPHLLQAISVNKNIWIGVSVENQDQADERIPLLLQVPAAVRFLSCEPLLEQIDLSKYYLSTIPGLETGKYPFRGLSEAYRTKWIDLLNWVIAGGESGPGARPMHPDWVRDLRDQCVAAGVPFFFKQWGEWWPQREYLSTGQLWNDNDLVLPRGEIQMLKITGVHDSEIIRNGGITEPVFRMIRQGKKKAGRMLDGREWNEMPNAHPDPKGSQRAEDWFDAGPLPVGN